jgi:hypothetical protein
MLKVGKERLEVVFNELFPPPVLDSALEGQLKKDCSDFISAERVLSIQLWDFFRQQALLAVREILGDDPNADVSSCPGCKRVEGLLSTQPSLVNFRLDPDTNYLAIYQARLDEVTRQLQLVEGELPPPRAQEPDRKLTPLIVDPGQWPDELPPPGWTVRREINS